MNLFFWKRKPTHPVIAAYRAATSKRVSQKLPINALRFVVLDSETSGFDIQLNRILSLALVEISNGRIHITRSKSWLLFQTGATLNNAATVHGILPAETASGQPEADVMLEFLQCIHGAILIGHHVGFDVAMINAALQRQFDTVLINPTLDTATFAMTAIEAFKKTAYPGQREPSLDEVCAQCEIAPVERHTAEGDTFTTAQVFLAMCAMRQRRLGRPLIAADLSINNG